MSTDAQALIFDVTGMDCGDCARTIERVAGETPGVAQASVNFAGGTLTIVPQPEATDQLPRSIAHNVDRAGYAAVYREGGRRVAPATSRWYRNRDMQHAVAALMIWIAAFAVQHLTSFDQIATALYIAAIAIGCYRIARAALMAVRVKRIDMNLLMTISVIGAAAIGEWSEGGLVVVLFTLGTALQAVTLDRTRNSIRALFELAPEEATVLQGDDEVRVSAGTLRPGQIVRVRPGERVPADGRIVSGVSAFNESAITGESLPVEKSVDASVFAGALNGTSVVDVEVTSLPEESTIATIIRLVEEAQAAKAPSQQMVDRFAAIYTPIVVLLAIAIFTIGWWLTGAGDTWFYRALVLLVIACPCALVISTPVSIVSAIGSATRMGVLVKGGAALEEAGQVSTIALDKTGTITLGRPAVTAVLPSDDVAETDLVRLAAAVEWNSEHPLARAIVAQAVRNNITVPPETEFRSFTSAGVTAMVDGRRIGVGNERLLAEIGVDVPGSFLDTEDDGTSAAMYVTADDQVLGVIRIADQARPAVAQTLSAIRDAGIRSIVMLTGDRRAVANAIGQDVGVDRVEAELLPQDKADAIVAMQASGERLMVVGDGVNDAPALALANVGVAMGMGGTDVALDSADMALMRDDLNVIPRIVRLSRETVAIIRQNITLSLITKLAALILGVFGFVSLWIAVIVDVGTSIVVTLNGMRLARDRDRDG